jgi:hypothetical protein
MADGLPASEETQMAAGGTTTATAGLLAAGNVPMAPAGGAKVPEQTGQKVQTGAQTAVTESRCLPF